LETLEGGFRARGSSAEDAIAGLSISHEIDKQTLADPQAGANATGGSHAQSSHRFTLSSRHSRSPGFRRVCRRPARIGAGPNRCATARDLPQAIAGAFSTKRSGSGPETSMSDCRRRERSPHRTGRRVRWPIFHARHRHGTAAKGGMDEPNLLECSFEQIEY
jgi:hypothetical protein